MSSYFQVRETFILRDGRDSGCLQEFFSEQFSLFGALLLQGLVEFEECRLKTENGEWHFSGKEVNADLQKIAEQLSSADCIDYSARYGYYCSIFNEVSNMAGPFKMMNYLRDEDNECYFDKEKLFYSCWNDGDDPSGENGRLFAFGTKDGKEYFGDIDYAPVSCEQTEGKWYSWRTDIFIDDALDEADTDEKVKEACEALKAFACMEYTTAENLDGGMIDVQLLSANNVKEYIQAVSNLMRISNRFNGTMGYFVDYEGDQNRLMHIDVHEDGSADISIAQI